MLNRSHSGLSLSIADLCVAAVPVDFGMPDAPARADWCHSSRCGIAAAALSQLVAHAATSVRCSRRQQTGPQQRA
jgi:hypothetical protein